MADTIYSTTRALETSVVRILSDAEVVGLPTGSLAAVRELKHTLTDARLDVRDYELAQTRVEQRLQAVEARKRLGHVREQMLILSRDNVFTALEIAQLTAVIDQVIEQLE